MDLPKPVHGMANVNLAVLTAARGQGYDVTVINTVPSYAAHFFAGKIWAMVKVLHTAACWLRLLMALMLSSSTCVYRPINGGSGQIYDLAYLLLCRVFFKRVYIHHHSFNYLNQKSRLFELLLWIAGPRAKHVVLGERMRDLLSSLYGIPAAKISELSNVAFFEPVECDHLSASEEVLQLGHLANLCVEKGAVDFVDLCRELKIRGVKFRARIAGPYADADSSRVVSAAILDIPELDYVGSLYATDKDDFFRSLDVFVFPSRYKNEAEPLVLYEAGQYGVLTLGSRRGCMQAVIDKLHGISVEESEKLVVNLADELVHLSTQDAYSVDAKQSRLGAFMQAQVAASKALTLLFNDMARKNVSAA